MPLLKVAFFFKCHSGKVTKWQSYKVTKCQSAKVPKLQSVKVIKLQRNNAIESQYQLSNPNIGSTGTDFNPSTHNHQAIYNIN